ncbi:MAG: chemotaxis protein CheA [Bacteroidetes bacterium]|jgi:two-component system chemotaxis sensor kinase CheA|nr:chemotaxis protein CheA [Bacteroidota bacterium]
MSDHPIFADDMKEIVESFIVESREIFEELDHDLLQLERTPEDRELIDRIFRAVHTVKGTSGFLSLTQMSTLAHRFEDVLNKLRQGDLAFQPAMMDVMFNAFDQMNFLLEKVVEGDMTPVDQDAVLAELDAILDGAYAPDADNEADAGIENVQDDAEATGAGSAPAHDDRPAPDADTGPASAPKASASGASEDASRRNQPAAPPSSGTGSSPITDRASETIRVEVDRLDNLMDLVGELVLGRNRLLQLVSDAETMDDRANLLRKMGDTTSQVDFITSELQTAVMRTRMVQVGRVFNKFPRVVRDLAREFDKKIDLVIEGEDTELDKSLIEEIGDPLTHLIRNAADHGIETPEERTANGKPERGTIRLSAAHEGNHILIEIEDDGAGIDPDALKTKAIEKDVITAAEAADMTDTEAFDLIFRPGFSTARGVSQVSGRGVGMDVVKTNLRRLNGSIDTESTLGEGTRFVMKLPLTLAIIQSLLVEVGRETFAIPLHSVTEVINLSTNEVHTIQGREVMHHRDRVLPLLRIGESLTVDGYERGGRDAYIVVVAIAHHRLGVVVDDLMSQKEIVIKPLGEYLKNVPAVAGSTILGDGSVILILDVAEMIRMRADELRRIASEAAASSGDGASREAGTPSLEEPVDG